MFILYKTTDPEELFLQTPLSDVFLNPQPIFRERSEVTYIGNAVINHYEFIFNKVAFWHGRMSFKDDLDLMARVDIPVARMIFSINSNVLYENYSGENDVFSFSPNQHNIIFSNAVLGKLNHKAGDHTEQFEINLHPEFMLKYLPQLELFKHFGRAVEQNQFAFLSPYNMPITAEMKILLNDIILCQKTDMFKRMYIEARIVELLMLQMEQYEQIAGNVICTNLKKTDINKMHEVRSIIDSSWKEPCSLIDLAQKVTTNEYNLKKSFKEVFGTTIFGYLNEVKMNEAKRLLLNKEMNVAEVADIIGYKNPNHFSTAFKKHFGYVPSELK